MKLPVFRNCNAKFGSKLTGVFNQTSRNYENYKLRPCPESLKKGKNYGNSQHVNLSK